jgi:redox-sensing transcriptional repressor
MDRPSDTPREQQDSRPRVPRATVVRLPQYLRFLRDAEAAENHYLSGARIAAALKIEPAQVRKDLAVTGIASRPGVGFCASELIYAIELYLGWNNTTDAFLVGAGHLGAALAGYAGFQRYGLNIVAVFDLDDHKVGRKLCGKPVHPFDQIAAKAQEMHVHMGIITVPSGAAQDVADVLVLAGIRAIWNFTPIELNVPPNIVVEKTDLAASLAVLSHRLADALRPSR